ncbi:MAG TPA: phosphate acyltransferase [Lachnospiraceae bacterium]
MLKSFEDVKEMLKKSPVKKRLGVVAAHDEHTLDAVVMAAKEGMIEPVLVGDEKEIKKLLKKFDFNSELAEIIPENDAIEAAVKIAELVKAGKLDCIMKGKIETGSLMKVMVNKETGIRKSETMSLVGFIDSPYYHKIFGITDVGLLTYPDVKQKKDAIENAATAFRALGVENPKVAVLAAVEKVNAKMSETVEAEQLKEMNQKGDILGCIVEGPISYDLAMDQEAWKIKGYQSPVAADADIVVVPNITAGNILIKSLSFTGGAKTCGVIFGAQVPLIITSRSSPVEDKFMSIVMSALVGKTK